MNKILLIVFLLPLLVIGQNNDTTYYTGVQYFEKGIVETSIVIDTTYTCVLNDYRYLIIDSTQTASDNDTIYLESVPTNQLRHKIIITGDGANNSVIHGNGKSIIGMVNNSFYPDINIAIIVGKMVTIIEYNSLTGYWSIY
jgi:hypothetical protein